MHTFGESGPAPQVYEYFGITSEHVAEIGRELISKLNGRS
jgi:transketolase